MPSLEPELVLQGDLSSSVYLATYDQSQSAYINCTWQRVASSQSPLPTILAKLLEICGHIAYMPSHIKGNQRVYHFSPHHSTLTYIEPVRVDTLITPQ